MSLKALWFCWLGLMALVFFMKRHPKRMNLILSAIPVLMLMAGCALNPYSKYYTQISPNDAIKNNPLLITSNREPDLLPSRNKESDFDQMFENGYVLIGYSNFSGPSEYIDDFKSVKKQALKVGSTVVLISSSLIRSQSGSMPLMLPNIQNGIINSGGNITTVTTYGNNVIYVPFQKDTYEYMASYWIKRNTVVFGAQLIDLNQEQKQSLESNKGACVTLLIKNSPAFNADILKGDIIIAIDDTSVTDCSCIEDILKSKAGSEVSIKIVRNGVCIHKNLKLNPIPANPTSNK